MARSMSIFHFFNKKSVGRFPAVGYSTGHLQGRLLADYSAAHRPPHWPEDIAPDVRLSVDSHELIEPTTRYWRLFRRPRGRHVTQHPLEALDLRVEAIPLLRGEAGLLIFVLGECIPWGL